MQELPSIVFEDDFILVFEKPSGMPSQAKPQSSSVSVESWLEGQSKNSFKGLVHRLDQVVSGLMIAAKESMIAASLTQQLRSKTLERQYLCWVLGSTPATHRLEHWLGRNRKLKMATIEPKNSPKSQHALLEYRKIKTSHWGKKEISLLEVRLETGRYHQIRCQLAHVGFPVLGDRKYGGDLKKHGRFSLGRPALHSALLRLQHPVTHETLEFQSNLPDALDL